jgi:phospholipid-binding lipoprotein MlaA
LRRSIDSLGGGVTLVSVFSVLLALALAGCGTLPHGFRGGARPSVIVPSATDGERRTPPAEPPIPDGDDEVDIASAPLAAALAVGSAQAAGNEGSPAPAAAPAGGVPLHLVAPARDLVAPARDLVAQTRDANADEYDIEEYDPWEPFNERMFEFNRRLDRYALKPVAKAYDKAVPDDVQRMIANAFDNVGSVKRLVNSLLQAKWDGAGREFGRFLVNTTVGIGGLFDVAKHAGIQKSNEDFGQTLGVYGAGPGPYLVLPFFEPMTVRDGIGRGVDGFLDPLSYLLSFVELFVLKVEETVNDRSLNLELFQGFEETVVDMYSAVRHAYLERRKNLIKE